MVTLRCTRKLLDRLPKSAATCEPRSTTKLGDWYANVLNVGRLRLVLCVNEPSRLSVLVQAKDLARSPGELARAAREVLLGIGAPDHVVAEEIRQMAEVTLAPTRSRSVLGSINDLGFMVRIHLRERPSVELLDVSLRLAEVPCSPLGYAHPASVARDLLTATRH